MTTKHWPIWLKKPSEPVQIGLNPPLHRREQLLIHNPHQAQWSQIQTMTVSGAHRLLYLSPRIPPHWRPPIALIALKKIVFFLDNKNILHRKNLFLDRHEPDGLLQGVVNWRFRFAVKKGGQMYYLKPQNWSHEGRLLGLEVHLLLRSQTNVYTTPHTYQFMGKSYRSKDLKLYRSWVFFMGR
jgi:hypothetical protein